MMAYYTANVCIPARSTSILIFNFHSATIGHDCQSNFNVFCSYKHDNAVGKLYLCVYTYGERREHDAFNFMRILSDWYIYGPNLLGKNAQRVMKYTRNKRFSGGEKKSLDRSRKIKRVYIYICIQGRS